MQDDCMPQHEGAALLPAELVLIRLSDTLSE
jgi:hypothetical protein